MRRTDVAGAVGDGVEQGEADDVRFAAGGDLAQDARLWLSELVVGLVPELAGVGVQADLSGGLGAREGLREQARQVGGGEGVGVAAFGEQALASAGDDQDPVEVAVGEFDRGCVAAQLFAGDVADQADVRRGGARGGGPGQDR